MLVLTCSLSSFTSLSFSALNFRTSASLPTVGDNSRRAMLASFSEMVASSAFCLKRTQIVGTTVAVAWLTKVNRKNPVVGGNGMITPCSVPGYQIPRVVE